MKTREEYIAHIKSKLDELNAQLNMLENKADDKKQDAAKEWQSHVDELKDKSKQLQRTAKEIQAASEDSWKSIKDGADLVLDDFKNTYKRVEQRLSASVS